MGTEVLRPQDCLMNETIRFSPATFHHRRRNEKQSTNRKAVVVRQERWSEQKKRSHYSPEPATSKRSTSTEDLNLNTKKLEMGRVTILRRGQSLDSIDTMKKREKTVSFEENGSGFGLLGTDPVMGLKQIRIYPRGRGGNGDEKFRDMYAGSAAFSMSPSPRSLPLPSFFNNKNDSATRDLRRLLRLE